MNASGLVKLPIKFFNDLTLSALPDLHFANAEGRVYIDLPINLSPSKTAEIFLPLINSIPY